MSTQNRELIAFSIRLLAVSLLAVNSLAAQTPSPSVTLGFGVDTTITDVRDIVALVRAYLAQPDPSARTRGLWTASTEFDRRVGDITALRGVYQGFPATVAGVIPAAPNDSIYLVRILYARGDCS